MRIWSVVRFMFSLPHGSFGASAYIVVGGNGYKSDIISQNDKSITKDNQGSLRCEIVLHSERNVPIGPFPTPPTPATRTTNPTDKPKP
jgi:hypothetical protein